MLLQSDGLAGQALAFSGGGARHGFATASTRHAWSIASARAFGSETSWPQGYNSPSALRMPVKTSGNISARFRPDADMIAALSADGNADATFAGEFNFSANGNVLSNGYATFAAEADMVASASATGNIAANMDLLARPSAFDIAQETWQSKAAAYNAPGSMGAKVNASGSASDPWAVQLDGMFTAADLLRIAASVLAGTVSGMETGNPVFKSLDGTVDRVTATATPEGNRTAVIATGG